MEIETHGLATFDLTSNNSPFSYVDHSELRASEFRSSDSQSQEAPEADFFMALDAGSPKCENVDDEMEPLFVPDVSQPGTNGSEFAGAESMEDQPNRNMSTAAQKVQKVYRSYRTRRMLADSAVVAEELWWQAIDFARLNHSTISFFDYLKPETAASRWNRVSLNASKVGKGLSLNDKAQKLAFQHWIEAIDPRHRYGHSLHLYYEEWCKADAGQPFFYWLDLGGGKKVDLEECPRSKLQQQSIMYLGPQEREHYEYVIIEGKIVHKQTGRFLDTCTGAKWIFVMSTLKRLYCGEKKKGKFHHSSFLAGGVTLAAGRLGVEEGVLKSISAYSGHYRPTDDSLDSFVSFLMENGVRMDEVEVKKANEDYEDYENGKSTKIKALTKRSTISDSAEADGPNKESSSPPDIVQAPTIEIPSNYKRTLSGGLQSPKAEVPKTAILQRINSKKAAKSYQLGHQISLKWSTGAGPRIGCVADYPVELRLQALELTNLSPRIFSENVPRRIAGLTSPSPCPTPGGRSPLLASPGKK